MRSPRHDGRQAPRLAGVLAALVLLTLPLRAWTETQTGATTTSGVRIAQAGDASRERSADDEAPGDADAPTQEELDAAAAESAAGPPSGVEVMRVRGRGIAAIETQVPSSVTQFDAATIEALGAQDISDLSRVTPNVNIVQPGSTQATFFVRGVGLSDFSSNAQGAVTIFQDDVAINAAAIQTGQLFDVDNVDVVKGPQGTGPFRNASAGAILVRSRRPTGNYSAQLRSSLGVIDTDGDKGARHALIQDYEGALEFPIVEDTLSSRFAFRLRESEPYRTNGCGDAIPIAARPVRPSSMDARRRGITLSQAEDQDDVCGERGQYFWPGGGNRSPSLIPEGLPRYVQDEHNWGARGTVLLTPPESELELFFNAHGSRLDQDSTLGQAIGVFALPGLGQTTRFAGETSSSSGGYIDRDVEEEISEKCPRPVGTTTGCSSPGVGDRVAEELASGRPLDRKPYRGDYDRVGRTTRDAWGAFVSAEATVYDDARLFVLSSYDAYQRDQDQDTDFTPDRLFEGLQSDEAWQTYQEVSLEGELASQPFEWGLGGYFLGEHLDNDAMTLLYSGTTVDVQRTYSQRTSSYGLWGKFSWDFADDFTLSGGVRYNYERKDFEFRRIEVRDGTATLFDDSVKQHKSWQTPTGEIILTYHLDEDVSAYARYTRGFKAGHFNALATQNLNDPPAKEEYNDAWEAGFGGSWFDRRVSAKAAFFYYRYTNYQVFLFADSADAASPPVLEIRNAKQAENFGIEIEGSVQPLQGWAPRAIEGLRLSANFGWLHGEYIDFVTQSVFRFNNGVTLPVPVDYSGQQLQNSPEYKVSGTAEWTFDLGRWGYLIPRYDLAWTDDVFFDPNGGRGSVDPTGGPSLIEFGVGQKSFFLHNVRLAYRTPTGKVELAGWIRNVDDQVYKTYAFDASKFTGIVINFPGDPRTFGMDFTVTF